LPWPSVRSRCAVRARVPCICFIHPMRLCVVIRIAPGVSPGETRARLKPRGERFLCAFRVAEAADARLAFARRLIPLLCPVVQPGNRVDGRVHRSDPATLRAQSASAARRERSRNWSRICARICSIALPACGLSRFGQLRISSMPAGRLLFPQKTLRHARQTL
jgi:hypothetical protein